MAGYQRCISKSFRCYNCETPGRINRATAQSEAEERPRIWPCIYVEDWAANLKTLVLGIGNPILGDDGVGFHVIQELLHKVGNETANIDIRDASIGGLSLLDVIVGYDKVVLVDAIKTDCGEAGEVYKLRPEDFTSTVHLTTSAHDTNLATALKIGNEFAREQMPKEVAIFAIEVEEVAVFTEEMTENVRKAIPKVVNLVLQEIGLS